MHTRASACIFGMKDYEEYSYRCQARSLVGGAEAVISATMTTLAAPFLPPSGRKKKSHRDPYSRLEQNQVHIREVFRFPYRKLSRCYENEAKQNKQRAAELDTEQGGCSI